jgi:predicted dehydrogenase
MSEMGKIRIGIIGAGLRGYYILKSFKIAEKASAVAEITAIADINSERMENAQQFFGSPLEMFTDYKDMLNSPAIDAVIIVTPDFSHKEISLPSIKSNKHVLVDKPLEISTANALAIYDAAQESDKIVQIGFNLRFDPTLQKVKELIVDGAIGEIRMLDIREFYQGGATFFQRWNRFKKYSGGMFITKGSHDFDVLNWLAQALPRNVMASGGLSEFKPETLKRRVADVNTGDSCPECEAKSVCPGFIDFTKNEFYEIYGESKAIDGNRPYTICKYKSEKDTHDNAVAIVEYDNDIRATMTQCFFTPITTRRLTVIGDRGILDADIDSRKITICQRPSGDVINYDIPEAEGGHGGADPKLLDNFVTEIKTNKCDKRRLAYGVLSVALGEAAERSKDESRIVTIDEVIPENHGIWNILKY